MAYSLTIGLALGSSQTGLTLRANLKDTAGTPVGGNVTTGFVELNEGNYSWTGTIPDGFQGSVVFANNVTTTVLAAAPINPADAPAPSVAAIAAQVTADHGAGDYTRNTEPLTAAGVRGAVGLTAANLDTQLGGINTKTAALPADPADASDVAVAFAAVNGTLATVTAKTNLIPAVPAAVGSAMTLAGGAISDASFTVVADPAVVPTGVVGWLQAIAARFGIGRRVKVDKLAGTIEVFRANGSTVWFTNVYSASADVEDVSAAV